MLLARTLIHGLALTGQQVFRPSLSKKSFPVGRFSKKNGQSGGRDFFFLFHFHFFKTRMYKGGKYKKVFFLKNEKKRVPVGPF